MQKQLIKYGFMAFSGVFLFINPIRAADDPCAEGSTCVWSLDDDGNLTIKSGTYKDGAFSGKTYNSVTIKGDVTLGAGALSGVKSENVKIEAETFSAGSDVFRSAQIGTFDIAKGNISATNNFALFLKADSFTVSGNNISANLNIWDATIGDIDISGNNNNLSRIFYRPTVTNNITVSGDYNDLSYFSPRTGERMTIDGDHNTLGSLCASGCNISEVEISGDYTTISDSYSFQNSNIDNIILSGNNITTGYFAFMDTTVGNLEVSGDDISFAFGGFRGIQAENIIFSGDNISGISFDRSSFTGNAVSGNIIFSEGNVPPSLWYRGGSDATFICSESEKDVCGSIKNDQTGIKPKVETYTYDEKTGLYNYKHKRYKDPSKIATGDYVPRRIYTLEEAVEVAGDKGNKFMLRYK